jgi:hypothetical protein
MVRALVPALAACALAAGCAGNGEEQGVVARVNGQPVHLQELESKYDMMLTSAAVSDTPSVEKLKSDYGLVLGNIIVQILVDQELDARGLDVTREEIRAAEAEVRSDYPDQEAFEQVLVEEYIDIGVWRDELESRLAMKKFFSQVLRPRVTLDYQEAEDYYRRNIKDFYLPPRVELVVIRGPSRDVVSSAAEHYAEVRDAEKLAGRYKELTVERVKIREDRLTMDWKNAISGLKPGDIGPVLAEDRAFTCLVFLDKSPAHVLEPSRAYPIVERVLLEQKLRLEFEAWLEEELEQAVIEVNPRIDLAAKYDESTDEPEAGLSGQPVEDADPEFPESEIERELELEEAATRAAEPESRDE